MRTRIALAVVVAFIAFSGVTAGVFGWYGYRVVTEMTPGSWRSPTEVLDRNGKTIVALYGADWRVAEPVVLKDLPEFVPSAFLAAEDSRFRSHFGVDPIGISRAAVSNVVAGGVAEGGSTITQQLAKTRFLTAKRTLSRKFVEAGLALMIELRLSKDEILEAYLNEVYLGHRDGLEVRGLGEAARVYFGKSADELTVAEAALIAGMVRAPNRDNPDERSKIAKQRRDAVLGVMVNKRWIDDAARQQAVATPAEFNPGERRSRPHPYLLAALRQEFIDKLGERRLATGGLKIYTAVDSGMQVAAEQAVVAGTRRMRASHGWLRRKKPLQAALLSIEPATGGIRALVGGSDFTRSQYDRTRLMKRQPGSAAKPFTYAAAIETRRITPASVIQDEPYIVKLASNRNWEPKNYDQQFRGAVTVRDAFEKSLNVPAVRVASDVGVDKIREVWHRAGITGNLSETPAIALGVDEVTMRELVGAYSIFPNLGSRSDPHIIERVTKGTGGVIYEASLGRTDVLDPAVAYVVHALMRGVVLRGTAASLNQSDLGAVAGKTGTTSNYRDAWFVGYAPDLLTAVWVGFDDGTALRMSSGEAAVPIWAAYMAKAPHAKGEIKAPAGVSVIEVEASTGGVWQAGCGQSVVEAFLSGTEPRQPCGGVLDGQYMSAYEEPALLSDEMAAAMAAYDSGLSRVDPVNDPDLQNMSMVDTVTEAALDTPPVPQPPVVEPPVTDSVRQRENRRQDRPRVIPSVPAVPPPPPRTEPQPQPQPTPPPTPTPKRDSTSDSLVVRLEMVH